MKSFLALVQKEFKSYFNSPIAYIALLIFQVLPATLFFFMSGFFQMGAANYSGYFFWLQMVFIFLIPAITMRSWAEERRQRTEEILVTLPYSEGTLVLAKFVASFLLMLIGIGLTLLVPFTTIWLGNFDLQILFAQYLGIILVGSLSLSFGLFVSSLCENQITAFLITIVALFLMLALWPILRIIQMPSFIAEILSFFSISAHFESFSRGLISSKNLIFLIGMSGLFLYANSAVLRFRKWN